MHTQKSDDEYMAEALRQARQALDADEVPVGAVVVRDGQVIARAHNQRELLRDPTAHAEMIAITQAAEHVGGWRLEGCTMYVTLEPCAMCAGALVLARLPRLVFGALDPKAGAVGSGITSWVRHEEEGQGHDGVGRQQQHPLEPVRLPVV